MTGESTSYAIFTVTETFKVDVRNGKFPEPFLLLQKWSYSNEALTFVTDSVLLTVKQYMQLKTCSKTLELYARFAVEGGDEMGLAVTEVTREEATSDWKDVRRRRSRVSTL
jgi:hypothetical protein